MNEYSFFFYYFPKKKGGDILRVHMKNILCTTLLLSFLYGSFHSLQFVETIHYATGTCDTNKDILLYKNVSSVSFTMNVVVKYLDVCHRSQRLECINGTPYATNYLDTLCQTLLFDQRATDTYPCIDEQDGSGMFLINCAHVRNYAWELFSLKTNPSVLQNTQSRPTYFSIWSIICLWWW